jgi:uncharacterized membrane protein YccC
MELSRKVKEAIKTGLAFALVYGIALKAGWANPYWAATAVAMISLGTAGESINKSVLRIAGTIPGCVAALVIVSLAPQNRWLFIGLSSAWIFFTTYMMLRSQNHAYFWMVAGFVCPIVAIANPASSEIAFANAVIRTVETMMGIIVYGLVTVFLWPCTNAGAIKKASGALVAAQADLFRAGRDVLAGQGTKETLQTIRTQEVQQLGTFAKALTAEGSESHEVHEFRILWDRFKGLSSALMETLDCWLIGFPELSRIDQYAVLPDLQAFYTELDGRFEEIRRIQGGSPSNREPHAVPLTLNHTGLRGLGHFDRAALVVAKQQLEKMDGLTAEMLACAKQLANPSLNSKKSQAIPPVQERRWVFRLPVLDLDFLRAATFAATSLAVVYLLWILVDPPGHAGWYTLGAPVAMIVAKAQQLKMTTLIKPLALAAAMSLAVYVFIMPQLSTFAELGLLMFFCMFINRYFFTGLAQAMGSISIINMISVQNQQTYNFAAMANTYIFILSVFAFIYVMSYMLSSARPEKVVLHLLGRFFCSAEFLVSRAPQKSGRTSSLSERWKISFYQHELLTLPAKLGGWGRAIDQTLFPANTPGQVLTLVASLQALGYRIEELRGAGVTHSSQSHVEAFSEDVRAWRMGIESTFRGWSSSPEPESAGGLQTRFAAGLAGLEKRIEQTLEQTDTEAISDEDAGKFYRILGGFRGVSEAAVAYARVAGKIDWAQWREERFS